LAPLFILKMYIQITQKLAQNSRGCKTSWSVQDSHLNLVRSEDYVALWSSFCTLLQDLDLNGTWKGADTTSF
jgi:hypothetical protein